MVRIEDPTGAGRGKDTRVVGIAHKCEGVSTNTPKLIVDHILESRTVIRVDPRARQAPGRRECGVGSTKTDRWLYRAACYARPIIAAESETDIGSSFDYVWRQIESHVIHELRSEEHTSELQSQSNLVCRLLLEKKKRDEVIIGHAKLYRSAM